MNSITRRQVLNLGVSVAASPLIAHGREVAGGALSYVNQGIRGFVIGTVRNRDITYFDALANTGAKVGRIFFPFTKCRDCERYGRAFEDIDSLKRILDLARVRGIRLVVVGDFPGTNRVEFWGNAALRESFVENWQLFSRTFGNDSVIAGLDLLNEPNPPWPSGKLEDAQGLWRDLAGQAIDVIRGEQISLPIIFEGVAGGSSMGLRNFAPMRDSNVVYSIHHYTPHDITHQHVNAAWTRTIPYPAGPEWELGKWDVELGVAAWTRQRMELDLRDVISFQRQYKVPIYVGEFSCVRWAPNRSRERYISDCLAIFRKFGWSWTYHEFRGWPGWDAEIDSEDRTVTKRSIDAPLMKMLLAELVGPPSVFK